MQINLHGETKSDVLDMNFLYVPVATTRHTAIRSQCYPRYLGCYVVTFQYVSCHRKTIYTRFVDRRDVFMQ